MRRSEPRDGLHKAITSALSVPRLLAPFFLLLMREVKARLLAAHTAPSAARHWEGLTQRHLLEQCGTAAQRINM